MTEEERKEAIGDVRHAAHPYAHEEIDSLARELDRLSSALAAAEAKVGELRAALEMIAGERQCLDNLMSNADIAAAVLASTAPADADASTQPHHVGKTGESQ